MIATLVWVMRDPKIPGAYRLITASSEDDLLDGWGMDMRWSMARKLMDPDAFADVCRKSFDDWCARNGWAM